MLISTSQAGSAFDGSATPGEAGAPLQPGTPAAQRIAIEYSAASGTAAYLSGGSVTAFSPSGAGLLEPAGASAAALNMFGAPCTFQGLAMRS